MADAPSTPGSYVGQSQNGYFWNGTSWDQGETTPSSAVPPSTMSLNSGAPTAPPLPPYQGVPGVGMGSPSPPPAAPAPTTPAPTTPTLEPTPQRAPTAGAPANVAAFVAKYRDTAEKISQQTGIPTERILAQAGFESGWNTNAPGNNLFGVKAGGGYKGKSQSLATHEADAKGNLVPTQADFRAYDSPEESFGDWANLIKKNYAGAAAPNLNDAQFAQALQQGGYGTDPNYAAKLHGAISTTRQALGGAPDGSSVPGGGSGGATSTATAQSAPFVPPAGLLAQSTPTDKSAASAAAQDKKESDAYAEMTKAGQGLLSQATTPAGAGFLPAPPGHRPQAQMQPFVIPGAQQTPPDFMQILAQQRLMQGT